MKKILLAGVVALLLIGCGSDTNTTEEITKVTEVVVNDSETINIDINDSETINVDVSITISAKEAGFYGEGTFDNPLLMANANYDILMGKLWMMSPSLNTNCTIKVRTLVAINNIYVEDAELLPIPITHITSSMFEFDTNSSYVLMSFNVLQDGFITIKSECLDSPKLYNY